MREEGGTLGGRLAGEGVVKVDGDVAAQAAVCRRDAVAGEDEAAADVGGLVDARAEGHLFEQHDGAGFRLRGTIGIKAVECGGRVSCVEVDLVHGDALEPGAGFAGSFEAVLREAVGDVAGGTLVGCGAGIAAFHAVVGESGGLLPPRGGCGGGGLLRG